MPHVRTVIRRVFKDALEATLPEESYRVFSSRKYARNHKSGIALVDMQFLNVNIEQMTMGDDRTHKASLYIRVQRDALETELDDALDNDEVLITEAVESTDWTEILEEEPELVQVNFSDDAQTDVAIGAIILRYDVEYRINKTNPETFSDNMIGTTSAGDGFDGGFDEGFG